MSSRPRSSHLTSSSDDADKLDRYKAYSFMYHGETDACTSDPDPGYDDEYDKPRYIEKELALEKINEELEKKSSEIFKKIERYRSGTNGDDGLCQVGQGDAPLSYDNCRDVSFLSCEAMNKSYGPFHKNQPDPPSPIRFSGSYFNLSRSSSSEAEVCNTRSSSRTSMGALQRRPATAGAVNFPNYSITPTEASMRRAETARPIDAIEEKHQIRLQKATESVLKCVQSKLVNYENRLADMHLQYRQKIQENTMLEAKVKALDEDRKRLLKSLQSLQSTTDRFSKSAENCKMNLNLKVQAFASLKKEMDSIKRDLKHKNGMIQSLQTRLDRCTEENRRLKSQHQSTQMNMKQQHNEDRSTMEDLRQRVIQLEQQKTSFQSTMEKQAQLIKTLRNQKVSLTSVIQKYRIKLDFVETAEEFDVDSESYPSSERTFY